MVALVLIFVVVYAAIALEHPLKISKSPPPCLGRGCSGRSMRCQSATMAGSDMSLTRPSPRRRASLSSLLGAMTIVEVIDAHDGFALITSRIRTRRLTGLLWLVSWVTFFLSAILDNLTTTIVMVSLIRKLLDRGDDRLLFASMIVIAANAGGAWSPMGDVTTTMLWIGGQVTALGIIEALFPASIVNLLVPLIVVTFGLRGKPFEAARCY